MRPIKFRAWNVKEKKMYSSCNYYLRLDGEGWSMWDWVYGEGEESLNFHRKNIATYVNGDILMQMTGLTDKNGKALYENDTISIDWGDGNVHGIVSWDYDRLTFWVKFLGNGDGDYLNEIHDFEIIGNIYQHPELTET